MKIRPLKKQESLPMDLLLLADPSQERIEKYCTIGEVFIIEDQDHVIGVIVLIKTSHDIMEIANIAVVEAFQGIGVGKKLLIYAIKTVKDRGYKAIEVCTGNSSIDQLAFYQKNGFRIIGVIPDFFKDNYKEEIFENGIQCRDLIRLRQAF
ncbi:GNAT family N-acetyltransferase [Evansella tamaricis]|uniref:GNAT family N-acetyltransferase n=1 Tax=Evansella tamaricis TaxID=2069301 RepID=A0ABS6JGZ7_9BACI|nr:GNAT family N-acetyltransferase [Evansella tamaricis]MBU9712494.1 GNAT family N-acetyltransferase [Evansella tamaricis]